LRTVAIASPVWLWDPVLVSRQPRRAGQPIVECIEGVILNLLYHLQNPLARVQNRYLRSARAAPAVDGAVSPDAASKSWQLRPSDSDSRSDQR